jgi:HUS1 checkpoint protein
VLRRTVTVCTTVDSRSYVIIVATVYMEGSMAGELTLRIDSDGSSIRTFFSKLLPRFEDTKDSQDDDDALTRCTLKVDTKKLSTALQYQATMTKTVNSALLCMVENEMLVVHVLLNPASVGFFTYYVPVHFLSSSELG